jgi:hypothetical protein
MGFQCFGFAMLFLLWEGAIPQSYFGMLPLSRLWCFAEGLAQVSPVCRVADLAEVDAERLPLVSVALEKLENRNQPVVDRPRDQPLVKAIAGEFQDDRNVFVLMTRFRSAIFDTP